MSRALPPLRRVFVALGWSGLGLAAIVVALSEFIARQPAGMAHAGPLLAPPSSEFPFGTDLLGRDMYSETIHALSVTAESAAVAAVLAVVIGGLLGFVAARFATPIRFALRWMFGVFASVPALLIAILLIGLTDRSFAVAAAGLAATPIAFVRAFDRARVASRQPHSEYARATGISASSLLRRDLTYEFRDTFLSTTARAFAAVAIILSTVSFLGFAAVPPHRDLGLMIAAARANYLEAWWTAAFPALALLVLVLLARLAAGLDEGERP